MKVGKKHLIKSLAFVMVIMLSLVACSNSNETSVSGSSSNEKEKEVYEFNVGNYGSSTANIGANILEPWAKSVEEKTDGRVKLNLFHGGTLGGANSVLTDVKGGVADISYMFSHYYADTEMFPLTLGDLPFQVTADDVPKYGEIIKKYTEPYHDEMFKDVVSLGFSTGSPSYIFVNKPVRKLEDFKGMKIRAASKSDVEDIKAWGAVPVSVPAQELYDSLAKGVIDGAFTSATQYRDMSLYEVAPYFVEIPYKVIQVMPIMNKASYDKLPDDIKTIFQEDLIPELEGLFNKYLTEDSKAAVDELKETLKKDGEVIQFDDAELERLQALSRSAWDQWLNDAKEKGYNGEEMMSKYEQTVKESGFPVPFYFK